MNRFFPKFVEGPGAAGLLLVRLAIGSAYVLHSLPKLGHPTSWMSRPHEPGPPGLIQFLAAYGEFTGGLCLIIGIVTPIAALVLAVIMVGALVTVHFPHGDPFVAWEPGKPSAEAAVVYLAVMIVLLTIGPGIYSLDAVFFRRRPAWI